MSRFSTTSRSAEQIARRGKSICPIDETIAPVVAARDCMVAPKFRRAMVPTAPGTVVAVTVAPKLVDLYDFDANQIPTEIDAELAECSYRMVSSNLPAWEALPYELRLTSGRNLAASAFWDRLNVAQKAIVSRVSMLWRFDPTSPWRVVFKSLTRHGFFHYCEYDPIKRQVISCDCEARDGCHHMRVMAQEIVPILVERFESEHGDSCAEKRVEFVQEAEAESDVVCPECDGRKRVEQLVHGRLNSVPCRTCAATGSISQERMDAIQTGRAIRDGRVVRLISQRDEAKRLNIDPRELNDVEHGRANKETMRRYENALRVANTPRSKDDF